MITMMMVTISVRVRAEMVLMASAKSSQHKKKMDTKVVLSSSKLCVVNDFH